MPALSFRLSPEDVTALRPPEPTRALPPPSPFAATPTVPLPKPKSLLRSRFPSPPTQHFQLLPVVPTRGLVLKNQCDKNDGVDTWSVAEVPGESRLWTLCCAVACLRPRAMRGNPSELLLPSRGHLESASAVTHLWSALGFLGYAIARAAMVDLSTTRGLFLVLAAFFGSATFFASTFYHVTTPDDRWAEVGRQADFVAIYIGVAVAFTADLCIVTREFSNVPTVAILDMPLAVLCVVLFFGYRRWVLPGDATLVGEYECSRIGLYRRWHSDLDSTAVRQATTLTIALFSFVLTPVLFRNLSSAPLILALQAASFTIVLCGMVLDSVFQWPDSGLKKDSWAVFRGVGCVITAHSIWHVAALVAGVLSVVAREVAFAEV